MGADMGANTGEDKAVRAAWGCGCRDLLSLCMRGHFDRDTSNPTAMGIGAKRVQVWGHGRVAEARLQDERQPGHHLPGDVCPLCAWCHRNVGATGVFLLDEGVGDQSLIWRRTPPTPARYLPSRAPQCREGSQRREKAGREGGGEAGPGPPGEGARSFPGHKTAGPGPGGQSGTERQRGTERHCWARPAQRPAERR